MAELATSPEDFSTDLCRQIGLLGVKFVEGKYERNDKDWYRKKVYILSTALAQWMRLDKHVAQTEYHILSNEPAFVLTSTAAPKYFNQPFNYTMPPFATIENTASWYDYDDPDANTVKYWGDYANAYLGGGVFGAGFVQEEIMCSEVPALANLAAWQVQDQGEWNGKRVSAREIPHPLPAC